MNPVKVLYIYGDTLQYGGIEMFMMNMFRNMDREKVQIDFLLQSNGDSALEQEILSSGSKIHFAPKPSRNLLGFYWKLGQVFLSGEYKIIHAHCDAMNFRILRMAKWCGIPIRIAHSHNTKHILGNKLLFIYYEYCRKHVGKYATECWACSENAGVWLYGKRSFTVIRNAIELSKFKFDVQKRKQYRQKYNIPDSTFLLGLVGRLSEQKNQLFFRKILPNLKGKDYKLLLVGGGSKKDYDTLRTMGQPNQIILTGVVSDPENYYHMMDLYVQPSTFEGFCIAVAEAETNGLRCLISDVIPQEVVLGGCTKQLPLDVSQWCDEIMAANGERYQDNIEKLRERGLDIKNEAKKVQQMYLELYRTVG